QRTVHIFLASVQLERLRGKRIFLAEREGFASGLLPDHSDCHRQSSGFGAGSATGTPVLVPSQAK
ncbi:MAG: hypothetical protein WAW63_05170, partial [Candidatus Saccharimonadales bacterium]